MKFTGTMKIGAIAAVLATTLAAAAPASADSYRGYFGDRDGAGIRVVVRDSHRDFRGRHNFGQRDVFFGHARMHHYGWNWRQRDREFRY